MTENIIAVLIGAILFILFLALLQISLLIYKFILRVETKLKNLNYLFKSISKFIKRNNER
jgi:hypothetical protein